MPLDPDARALVDALSTVLPAPFHQIGLDAAREFSEAMGAQGPDPKSVHSTEDRNIPGPNGDIPVRIYRPSADEHLPVLVWIHGGGWSIGGLEGGTDVTCRELANRANCVVVSIDYRLAPEHKFPAPFEDCYAALVWVLANASDFGGDPARVAIGGDSAGANLSAAVCIAKRDNGGPSAIFQLLAYPATEYAVERPSWTENAEAPVLGVADVIWFWDFYLRDEADRTDWRATPSNAESLEGVPPAFVLTAEFDPLRDDGENFGRLLQEAGVDVHVKRYPGVFHGFFTMGTALQRTDEALDDAADSLRKVFAGGPVPTA